MMKNIKIILSLCIALSLISCEITNFSEDLQINPNLLTPESADPNFLLNNVQKEVSDLLQDLNRTTDEVMRYTALNETYADVAEPNSLNSEYTSYYAFIEDANIIDDLALTNENLRFIKGISTILTSFATITMVDYLGDIPYSEANRVDEGLFNPAVDNDEDIYNAIIVRINDAILDLNSGAPAPTTDLYYSGDPDKWTRLANSLKLKMFINMGNKDQINTLISENNFIESEDDFQFNYSTNQVDPNSRHPDFNAGYEPGGYTSFLGNSFMNLLLNGKSVQDPRLRYYIYRQSNIDPSDILLGCLGVSNFNFCYLGNSYYGRDHGDIRSNGADQIFRATYGLYPVGGTFDENNPFSMAIDSPNQEGAGILPILLSSYVDFLRAEAALSLDTSDNALQLLESGMRKSMHKVLNFKEVALGSAFAATQIEVENYIAEVLNNYAAADNQGKLDIVLEEYYIASYGNSTESYNGYRRTGFPSSLQKPIFNINVPFPRTFSFPEDAINFNNSINQRPITTQVFWDTNPVGFIQ
jgi:hypothetical protein